MNRTTAPDRGSASDRVSVAEGIAYGYRMMCYYIGVIVLGQLALGVGLGLIGSGLDVGYGADPNWATVAVGFGIGVVGALTVCAGFFGAVYKLIVDGVARGHGVAA